MKTRSTRRSKQKGGVIYASLPSCISDARYSQLLQSNPEMADFYNPRAFHKKLPAVAAPAANNRAQYPAVANTRVNKGNASLNPRNVGSHNEIGVVNRNVSLNRRNGSNGSNGAKPQVGVVNRNVSLNRRNVTKAQVGVVNRNVSLNRRNGSNNGIVAKPQVGVVNRNVSLNRRNAINGAKPPVVLNNKNGLAGMPAVSQNSYNKAVANAFPSNSSNVNHPPLNRRNAINGAKPPVVLNNKNRLAGMPAVSQNSYNKAVENAFPPAPAVAPAPAAAPAVAQSPVAAAYHNAPVTPNVLKPSAPAANNARKYKMVQPAPGAYPPRVVHVNNVEPKHY